MRQHEARLGALKRDRLRAYPCVRAKTLARALHSEGEVSAEQVMERWREGQLIGIRGPGGPMFPWFQVDARRGRIQPAVVNALRYFDREERASGWPVFLWFSTPRPVLGKRIPADCLEEDPEAVRRALRYEENVAGG